MAKVCLRTKRNRRIGAFVLPLALAAALVVSGCGAKTDNNGGGTEAVSGTGELTAGLLLQRMPLRKRRMPGQPRKRKKQRPQRSVGPELRLLPPAVRTRKPERRTLRLMPKKRTPKLMPKRRPPRPPQEAGPALRRMPLRQKRALRQPKRRQPRLPQGAGPALRLLPPAARIRKPEPKAPSPKRRGEEALMRKADPETLKKTNMPASAISPAPRWAFLSNTIRQIQRKTRRPAPVKW